MLFIVYCATLSRIIELCHQNRKDTKMINEQIKHLRKSNNLTQEELAEKLNVSRQAITKWESGLGTPDISNIEAIAKLFNVSIDELLNNEEGIRTDNVSRTEFDIFSEKDFEIRFDSINSLDITLGSGDKVVAEVMTDLEEKAYELAKVKLDDAKTIDMSIINIASGKKDTISKQDAKNHIFVKVILPESLADKIELSGCLRTLKLHDFTTAKEIEFDGKVEKVTITDMQGHLELNSNLDMEIEYDGSMEQFDINQLNSTSNIYVPKDADIDVYAKGRGNKIVFNGFENKADSAHKVELNGFRSELTVVVR